MRDRQPASKYKLLAFGPSLINHSSALVKTLEIIFGAIWKLNNQANNANGNVKIQQLAT